MRKILLLIALFTFSLSSSLYSIGNEGDPAIIKGKVIDQTNKEPLIGANIAVAGTSIGASSDLDGEFTIPQLPAGTYTVMIRYIGYKNIEQTIELKSGEIFELNVSLEPESIMGEEVVVTAQISGQRAAINQQRSSNSITNIVSSDRIREVPDANAAESIGRLPGVSLKRSGGEADKVVIRGLSPQFAIVEVDGVRMAGNSGDRGVGLSSVSSEMLAGIELSKSLTADKDADAIAGIVNLRTRVAGKGLHYNISTSGAYTSVENSINNYKLSGDIGNRFLDNKLGVLLNVGAEQISRSADKFGGDYQKNITDLANELYTNSAQITEKKRTVQRKYGSLVLDYKTDFMKLKLSNFYSQKTNEEEVRKNNYRFNKSDFQFDISSISPEENLRSHSLSSEFKILTTQLDVNLSYSKSHRESYIDLYHFDDAFILTGNSINPSQRFFAQPDSLIRAYYPNSIMSMDKTTLTKNTRTKEVRDDITKALKLDWKAPFRLGDVVSGNVKVGVKYSKKERSANDEARFTSFRHAESINEQDFRDLYPYFKTLTEQGVPTGNGMAGVNFADPDYDYGKVLNGLYELPYSPDLEFLKESFNAVYDTKDPDAFERYHRYDGKASNKDDYTNIEEMMAGYAMAEINIGRKLMLLPGIRYESMHTEYSGNYIWEDNVAPIGVKVGYPKPISVGLSDTVDNRDNKNWFPSVNAKFKVNDWMSLRAAYFSSTARPDYALLSPSMIVNADQTELTSYNPYLKPALADNFDLAISFYSNKLGLFTINAFYKEISGLIYKLPEYRPKDFVDLEGAPAELIESLEAPRQLYNDDLFDPAEFYKMTNNNMPINNPNISKFKGVELSWQTNFWYLPGLLSGLVLDLNFSMIQSETKLPYIYQDKRIDNSGRFPIDVFVPVYKTRTSKMLDQPTMLWNARIGWDYKGFSSRLSFRYQGETTTKVDPIYSLGDEILVDVFRIDLSLKQQITERLSATLDIANMNRFIDVRNQHAAGNVLPRSMEYYGAVIQMGLKYAF